MFDYIPTNMDVPGKYSLLINYGPKELEIFGKIKDDLSQLTNTPENKNEIARRGLNSFKNLIEVDVSLLLKALSNNLKALYVEFNEERFDFANSLALSIYAAMICKKGNSESELFESIVLNMKLIDKYQKHHVLDVDTKENIRTVIDHLSKSIDVIFLRKTDMQSKFLELESYYEQRDFEETTSNRVMIGVTSIVGQNSMEFEQTVMAASTGQESLGEKIEATSTSNRSELILLRDRKGVGNP
jgi:hypothetical protein